MPKRKPEAQFEKDLFDTAMIMGCCYIKIPDTNMINRNNRHQNRELKRPFDGILITPDQNFCIECKINSNSLIRHQESNQNLINFINNSFFVFRKRIRKNSVAYQIEYNHEMVYETSKIENLIKFCKGKKNVLPKM